MFDAIENTKPKKYFIEGKFNPHLLANDIMAITDFHALKDTHEIYYYTNNVWKENGEEFIRSLARKALGDREKKHYINEVVESIRDRNYTDREEMGWPQGKIHVENGLLDLETRELEEFSSTIFSTTKIPVEYDPDAECPAIESFLDDILHEDDKRVVKELIGYCLVRDYPIHRAFMFKGTGANGKSTLIELIRSFLGPENTASVGLRELTEQRFATADLFGKLANLHADLPRDAMQRTGPFKMATGMDTLRADKKHKSPFHFVNHAKMIFSANKVPEAKDDTVAFHRRWRIIEFPNKFVGDDADPDILERLTTDRELSGLLNVALDHLDQLLERGEFYHSDSIEERQKKYVRASNPVQAFVMDRIESDPENYLVFRDLYDEFKQYCNEHDLPTRGPRQFGGDFQEYQTVETRKKTVDGDRKNCYVGIKVKGSNHNRQLAGT